MYPNLRDFVNALEREGELVLISAPVSPMLEITEIADRVSKSPCPHVSPFAQKFDPEHAHLGGKALLFENVVQPGSNTRSPYPLLINAWGSYHRVEMALGCDGRDGRPAGFEGLAEKIGKLVKPEPPVGLIEKLKKGWELVQIAAVTPKVVRSGACQQIVKTGDDVNLLDLPIIKCWPLDGNPQQVGYNLSCEQSGTAAGLGRYITFAGIFTIHPDDAGKSDDLPRPSRNIGMYRAQLIDQKRTAMHWHMHHDGARHWRAWKKADAAARGNGQTRPGMPCALVFGGESVMPYAATAPLPPGVSELLMAGFLHGSGIELVKCKTVDLHVPASAELVIEGYVSTEAGGIDYDPRRKDAIPLNLTEEVFEGPFGDHTGFYSLPDRYPVFKVTAITQRKDALYPTTIVGLPPQEDYYLGKATERVFKPLLQMLVPDILDYHLPMFGAFHNCAFVKIRKEYPLQARRVMHAIWGAGQMAWTKMIVVVDEEVDVHRESEVLFHLCANCDPGRDIELVHGPVDILDHSAPRLGAGTKIGFDATRKIEGEQVHGLAVRDFPPILKMTSEIKALVENRWKEYGL